MSAEESPLTNVAVPTELKDILAESFETIEDVRQFLKGVYEENRSPDKTELIKLERKLIFENFNIKKQSDSYYEKLKNFQDKYISERTLKVNRTLYKNETRIKLQKAIQEINSLAQSSMNSIEQIPELKLEFVKDISNYDKLELESLYARDKVLEKLTKLDSTIENSEYDATFKKDLNNLQSIIQAEKLQRFKLYILNKSLYTNRFKKLKDLDTKWSSRLDELIKMEQSISEFQKKLNAIQKDETEKQQDDAILSGLGKDDEEEEEEVLEEEEEEEHHSEEEEEEDNQPDAEEDETAEEQDEEESITEEEQDIEDSKKRIIEESDAQIEEVDFKKQKQEGDEMDIENSHSPTTSVVSDGEDLDLQD